MTWTHEFPVAAKVESRSEAALRAPVGMASPLWFMFGAAASAGVAYWWMTQWTRVLNVEAFAPPPLAFATPSLPELAGAANNAAADVAATVEAVIADAPIADASEALAPQDIAVVETAVEEIEVTADDLTRLVGIGPKLAASLAERGVTRFAQIAAWTETDLAEVDAALSLKGRAVREAWVAQAKRLMA